MEMGMLIAVSGQTVLYVREMYWHLGARIDRMLYIIQRGCIIIPSVVTSPEDRKDDTEIGVCFQSVLEILYEICVGDVSE